MIRKLIGLVLLLLSASVFWYLNFITGNDNTLKLFQTSLAFLIIYFIFRFLIESLLLERIKDNKTQYSLRKTTSMIQMVILLFVIITIWIENVQGLFVAYGLIAAGVAVALQDFFRNIMGGFIILTRSSYRAGDRIEINGRLGDVIDVGIMYSTLLELKEWVSGDQATGRLLFIPNGWILAHEVINYTKDNTVIWDELMIPITHNSDWKVAQKELKKILVTETKEVVEKAEKEIAYLSKKYYLSDRVATPSTYIKITDNWIELYLRYVTHVRERRQVHSHLSELVLSYIETHPNIEIATESLIMKKSRSQ